MMCSVTKIWGLKGPPSQTEEIDEDLGLDFLIHSLSVYTGKSLSEALILGSTDPQYDKRMFIDLPVQYMKTTSSEHVVYIIFSECQIKKQFVYTTCSELVVFIY